MREQFLVEIGSGRELDDMVQLNTLFTAWVETVYQQAPLDRWSVIGTPALPSSAQLREHSCGRSTTPPAPAPAATGIDYLRLVEAEHTTELVSRDPVVFT